MWLPWCLSPLRLYRTSCLTFYHGAHAVQGWQHQCRRHTAGGLIARSDTLTTASERKPLVYCCVTRAALASLTDAALCHAAIDYYTYRPQSPFNTSFFRGPCPANASIKDLWDTNRPAKAEADGTYEEEILWRRTSAILEDHDPAIPLFFYYAFHLVHAPLQVPDAWMERFDFIKDSKTRQTCELLISLSLSLSLSLLRLHTVGQSGADDRTAGRSRHGWLR